MDDSVLLSTVLQQLGELRAEMNQRFSQLEARIDKRWESQDIRLTRLERWQGKIIGGLTLGVILLQVLFRLVWK